ncbi:NUDIX hydrolase [Catellatospora methionotrophica]|uniref:NUDIX hydrolase n=1 Tax=Catellatospora methionotrophica TaxID=121620 RepID=A0A8J3PJE4_9ACTN|nr:NUDIX domain-containing protein [Catellatospora methionotrophica]GIG18694.1 NUDIX hydrolase [Catellatospora methionotrophica]
MNGESPLYQRDPEAWQAYLAEGNRVQPRKRVGADVLFRDQTGNVLIVEPQYKPGWDLPGGMAEANEAPVAAAAREVAEELGLAWSGGRLLVLDWVPPHGPWDDSLMFVFDGGLLTLSEQQDITLSSDELASYAFVPAEEAPAKVGPRLARRLDAALRAMADGVTVYLHDGRTVEPVVPPR